MRGLDLSVFLKMAGDLVKPLKEAEDQVAETTNRMNKRLSLSLKMAGAGAVATGIKSVTAGFVSDFTQSYREVQRASGDLRSLGMQDIKAVIAEGQKLQNTYVGLSTDAFVRAAYDIKSGVSSLTDEGVAVMTSSALTVAKATKGMPESMTSLFATSYGIFKKQFSEMSDADWGDMFGAALSKSVQQFKTDGAKMQQAIESAGAGATNLGMEMTEQMALLGMMQQQMQAGEAGTALRAFATNSAKAHEQFGKLAKTTENKVVVRILDENGQMRAMPDILSDLKARYGETLDAFGAAEIKEAFGTDEAMKMIDALYGQEEAVRANAAALEDAANQGAAFTEAMAKSADDYEGADWEKFLQRIDVIKQKIAGGLLPAMDGIGVALKPIIEGFGKFASDHPKLVSGLGMVVVGLGGIATVAAPLLFGLSALTASFGALKMGVMAVGRAFLFNPIGLAVTAIAGGAYLIWKNWEPIKAFFINLWEGVKTATSAAWEWIKSAFLNYHPAGIIYSNWDGISDWFGQKWDQVKTTFTTKWEAIKAVAASWPAAFKQFGIDMIQGLINGLKSKLTDLKNSVTGIGSSAAGWFKDKLGIKSPSRVFMGFGQNLSEGLGIGIQQSAGGVFASLEKIRKGISVPMRATAAIGAASMAGAAIGAPGLPMPPADLINMPARVLGAAGGSAVTYAPTYHITLGGDLSEVMKEQLRQLLEEHDRQARLEWEARLGD